MCPDDQYRFNLCVACGHPVEAGDGGEFRHMPVSKLPVRVSAAEDRRALWTDLPEGFRDDHSPVPGWC